MWGTSSAAERRILTGIVPLWEQRRWGFNKEILMKKQLNGIALLLLGILFALAGGQLDILGITGLGIIAGIFGALIVYWNSGET